MRKMAKGVFDMNKETYKRASLEITEFEAEDVIATSGEVPSSNIPKDKYEGEIYS